MTKSNVITAIITGLAVTCWYQTNPCKVVRLVEENALSGVVYCARDIPANKVITRADLQLKKVRVSKLPANPCDCIYVPLGRKLPCAFKKGEYLSYNDFGLGLTLDSAGGEREPPVIIEP